MVIRFYTAAAINAAVCAGAGIGILPIDMADPSLVCLWDGDDLPRRELWLVMHEDLQSVPRVRAVFDFLREVILESTQGAP